MDKKQIISTLNHIGSMMELLGENRFKVAAYYNVARTLETISETPQQLVESGKLGSIKGVGKALEEKITTLVETGSLPLLEELAEKIPSGVIDMLAIAGLGPKKVHAVWQELGLTNIGELEYACRENRLALLKGFGDKSQAKVLSGIEFLKKHSGRVRYPQAEAIALAILPSLENHPSCEQVSLAGSLRRRMDTIKDIDFVVATNDAKSVMEHFTTLPEAEEVTNFGDTKSSIITTSNISVDLRCVEPLQFPYALHHFTGSKEHNTMMRSLSKKQGLKMNEYGLFRGEECIPCADEEAIVKALGLAYIPPELREGTWEIEAAKNNALPELLEEEDIRGIFHVHSDWSDGLPTLEEIAREGERLGLEYIGMADHSQTAVYAHGLNPQRIREQHQEIDRVNSLGIGCRLLKGIESDILGDGSLDYDDDTLALFDFVIASVHSRFNLAEAEQTQRLINAASNPYTTMMGHLTGRLLLSREGYSFDIDAVLSACASCGTAVEINASPYRLDLDWRMGKRARELGVMVSINPDAHRLEGFGDVRFGVYAARKGGWSRDQVINTRGWQEALDMLKNDS
jgi:DNA polymerase (family X)